MPLSRVLGVSWHLIAITAIAIAAIAVGTMSLIDAVSPDEPVDVVATSGIPDPLDPTPDEPIIPVVDDDGIIGRIDPFPDLSDTPVVDDDGDIIGPVGPLPDLTPHVPLTDIVSVQDDDSAPGGPLDPTPDGPIVPIQSNDSALSDPLDPAPDEPIVPVQDNNGIFGPIDPFPEFFLAPIHDLHVEFPGRATETLAVFRSGTPNGCTSFSHVTLEPAATAITMNVWNITPHQDGDTIACSAIYGFIEHAISLGSEFLPGVDYTLIVNDVERNFSLPGS